MLLFPDFVHGFVKAVLHDMATIVYQIRVGCLCPGSI